MEDSYYSAEEKGNGQPVLFLHGYLSCKESFYYQTQSLSRRFRTVAVDLPGFGKTPEPSYGYALDDYVDFARAVIKERCGGRACIVAHSFGGRIAIKLAAEYPECVRCMILTGCAGMKPRRNLKYRVKKGTYSFLKRVMPSRVDVWREKFSSSDYRALSPVMKESFVKITNEHLEGCLGKISAPVLFVFGEKDTETPLYMARRLYAGVKGSGLVIMKGCGHFCFSEDPVTFNAVAEEFLAGQTE